MNNKKLLLSLIFLLFCFIASAHAGMMDRWIHNSVNMSAVHATVGTVQLVLSAALLLIWKNCPVNNLLRKVTRAIARKKTFGFFFFWVLTAFALAPYVGYIDACYLIVGMAAFGMAIVATILSFFKGFRKFSADSKCLYVLSNLTLQQIIGYAVYSVIYNMAFFKELFGYTDEEYQMSDYYVYPGIDGIRYCLEYGVVLLILFLLPMTISIVLELVKRKKEKITLLPL